MLLSEIHEATRWESRCSQNVPISSRVLSFVSGSISHMKQEHNRQMAAKTKKAPPGQPRSLLNFSTATGNHFETS